MRQQINNRGAKFAAVVIESAKSAKGGKWCIIRGMLF